MKDFFFRRACVALAVLLGMAVAVPQVPAPCYADESDSGKHRVIVSLGDSYSSGEGIEPFYGQDAGFLEKVHNPDWIAHRSQDAWPGMLSLPSVDGKMSDNRNENWFFAAASGAKTMHMLAGFPKKYKRHGIVSIVRPCQYVEGKFVCPSQYVEGEYELEPQLNIFNELGGRQVDYVTLTLGGNDACFEEVIQTCVLSGRYFFPGSLSDKLNDIWKDFFITAGIRDRLYDVYRNIEMRAGTQAQIIVAGYPKLLNPGGGSMISEEEAGLVNENVSKFNHAIESIVHNCQGLGMKISFVSVEEDFEGKGAYSDNPHINKIIIGPKAQELTDDIGPSAYSIHPTKDGACLYAKCVQDKINELERMADESGSAQAVSAERNVILALDVSGSMKGAPLEETKKASSRFLNTVFEKDASIGIVTYNTMSQIASGMSNDRNQLRDIVSGLNSDGGTNIEAGLRDAWWMLAKTGARKKMIVLMSDGEPNEGLEGGELAAYADEIKRSGTTIYTIGFFGNLGSLDDKTSAQRLMEEIASDGCHYEVENADELVFFFEDMADQMNGTKYIYIRIACPVDVSVTYQGETLDSSEENLNGRTSFGTLTFEENDGDMDGDARDRIKILRLKEGADYELELTGTGYGTMNYTIGFMDDDGNYSDLRRFEDIRITQSTRIDTVASNSDSTALNIDEDGDGKYDRKLQAGVNGYGEEVAALAWTAYAAIGVSAFAFACILIFAISIKCRKNKKF